MSEEHPVTPPRFDVTACNTRRAYHLVWQRNMPGDIVSSRTGMPVVKVVDKRPAMKMVWLDRFTLA